MRLMTLAGALATLLILPSAASAQDYDDFSDAPDPGAPLDVSRPATEPETTSAGSAGGTDHDVTIGAWGFQVTDAPEFAPLGEGVALPMVGVRRWGSRQSGLEAGALFLFAQEGADPEPSTTAFGGTFGYLRALGIAEHMTVFWEPSATLLVIVNNDGVDGTDDPTQLLLNGKFSIGTEVRLGFFGLPRLGMTARLSAGLSVINDGSNTDFLIGNDGGVGNSVDGLLDTSIGFVWYTP